VVDGFLGDGGATTADHEDDKRGGGLRMKCFQNGLGGADRVGVGRGVSALEVAEAVNLVGGLDGAGDDAFELSETDLGGECLDHGVSGLTDRDDEYAAVGVEVVEILANAQDAALAVHVARECAGDAGFGKRVLEDLAGGVAHGGEGGGVGHDDDYREGRWRGTEYPLDYSVVNSESPELSMLLTYNHESIRELRLNRPPVNALTTEVLVALREAIEKAPSEGVRALVLSGSPGRFSGGLDVPALLKLDKPGIAVLWRELYAILRTIACSRIPIVAAITGHAPAGGTVLSLFCDGRVMAEGDYKIGLNEVQVGIPLPPIILAGLQRLVGMRMGEQLAVSGALMSSQDALRVGLVDELAPAEQVVERALAWCKRLLAVPAEAFVLTRRDARADLAAMFDRDLEKEAAYVTSNWWSEETQRTLKALVERLGKK